MVGLNRNEMALASALADAADRLNVLLQQASDAGLTIYIRAEGANVEQMVQLPTGLEDAPPKAPRIIIETLAKR